MARIFVATLTLLFLLSSCGGQGNNNGSMDDVVLISEFPNEGGLSEMDCDYDGIGLRSLKVVDSLIILDHKYSWEIITPQGLKLAQCFSVGPGPDEFVSVPYAPSSAFIHENDSLLAYVYDSGAGNVKRMNLTKLISSGEEEIRECVARGTIPALVWGVIPCDSTSFLMHTPNETITGFSRILNSDGIDQELEVTVPISAQTVKTTDNINLLAKVTAYSPRSSRFAEAMTSMNQINLYSKDGKWGKIICVGDKLDEPSAIEAKLRPLRVYTYNSITPFDKGFLATYCGMTAMNFDINGMSETDIHIFDWDGNPVYRLKLPFNASYADIDFKNKVLYAIDAEEDRLRMFDATPIVNAFSS